MDQITEGDVVRLKSGGPKMTVSRVLVDKAKCIWFSKGEGDPHERAFVLATIAKLGKG